MSGSDSRAELFRRKSRTFSLAARLFSRDDQEAVNRLYQFCRELDDLADDTAEGNTRELDQVILELQTDNDPVHPLALDFRALASERELPIPAACTLAQALRDDCGPRTIESEEQLLAFAYGVAGTVGILMCPVLGVSDPRAVPFAVDLGIGLQLTNIARDVVEDAARQRYYLPAEWVRPKAIQNAIEGSRQDILLVDKAIKELLSVAETFYTSGLAGHGYIRPRNRRAVFLATLMYREIGRSLLKMGSGAWLTRRSLSPWEKAKTAFGAVGQYRAMHRSHWSRTEAPTHESSLAKKLKNAGVELSRESPA